MPPLHQVLPDLERAVETRRESAIVTELGATELRLLIYQIVEAYQRELGDPALYLERLVAQSGERRDEVDEATERSVGARESVLRELLAILEPAMPALLGPVPAETWNVPGKHEERDDHPVLRGFELLDGKRLGNAGTGKRVVTGRSWWIVALRPEDDAQVVTARYAALDHGGEVNDHRGGEGHSFCEVKLVPVSEAAAQIRDDVFDKVIAAAIRRLRSVGSNAQRDLVTRAEAGADQLQLALRALRGKP